MTHRVLDTTGLTCPLPVLKARKALAVMPAGEALEVLSTDPNASLDFQVLCRTLGHEIVAHSESGGVYRTVIRRGP